MLLLWVGFYVGKCPMFQIILEKKTKLTDCGAMTTYVVCTPISAFGIGVGANLFVYLFGTK
jgi:hypothetical protein